MAGPESFQRKARRVGSMINALALPAPQLAGKIAFRLFCSPRRVRFRSRDVQWLDEGFSGYFPFDDLQLAAYKWSVAPGIAPKGNVLFMHGWESSSARWAKYAAVLRAEYNIWAFDAPAHGRSEGRMINLPMYARAFHAFIAVHGMPDMVVGHSMGASALVAGLAEMDVRVEVKRAVVLAGFSDSTRVFADFFSLLDLNERVQRSVLDVIRQRTGRDLSTYTLTDKAALLSGISGLVVHDTADTVTPIIEGMAIADAWGARFMATEGAGHRLQEDQVVKTVLEFLTTN